jgi:hypothetical protein
MDRAGGRGGCNIGGGHNRDRGVCVCVWVCVYWVTAGAQLGRAKTHGVEARLGYRGLSSWREDMQAYVSGSQPGMPGTQWRKPPERVRGSKSEHYPRWAQGCVFSIHPFGDPSIHRHTDPSIHLSICHTELLECPTLGRAPRSPR